MRSLPPPAVHRDPTVWLDLQAALASEDSCLQVSLWDRCRRVRLIGDLDIPKEDIGRGICIQPPSVIYSSPLPSTWWLLTHGAFHLTDRCISLYQVLHALSDGSSGRSGTPSSLSSVGCSVLCPLCVCWLWVGSQNTRYASELFPVVQGVGKLQY